MRSLVMLLLLLSVLVTSAAMAGGPAPACPAQPNMTPAVEMGTPQPILVHHYNCRFVVGCGSACECRRHNCVEDCSGNPACIAQCDAAFGACINDC